MPRVSVVIPARNAAATIGRTLEALAAQSVEHHVIVVDDASTDDTVAIARAAGAAVIEQPAQAGPAEARNRGAASATATVLAFTDADCFPAPGWLAAGLATIDAGSDLVQGRVVPERPPRPFERTLYVSRLSGLWEAANLFVRAELFESLGGFEEWVVPEIGKAFGEDLWFGWRATRAGARTAFAEGALVEHAVFERGPLGYIDERRRLRYFPAAVKLVPELREHFLLRGVFLNQALHEWDAALLGLALARRWRPAALLAFPFAARLAKQAVPHGRHAPVVAATEVAANVVSTYSLVRGSIAARTLVI